MLCKSCKRKIDENLCPYCGHNNGSNQKNNFNIDDYYSQSSYPNYDSDRDGVISDINEESISKMNTDYKQHTKPVSPYGTQNISGGKSLGNATQGNRVVGTKQEEKPSYNFDMPDTSASKSLGNATQGNRVVGTRKEEVITTKRNGETVRITKTTQGGVTSVRKETLSGDNQYNWDSSSHQWQGDVRNTSNTSRTSSTYTTAGNPLLSKIVILAILLLFGFGSFPVVGLVMMFVLKKSCKEFLIIYDSNNQSYGLVKVINVLVTISIVGTIIAYLAVFALALGGISA